MMIFIQILLFFNVIQLSTTTTTTTTIIQDRIDEENNTRIDTAGNWCCKINPGIQATSQTRQTTFYIMQHGRHKCGYDSCGVFGWSRCTRWCDETWSEIRYGVETYIVYTNRICPNDQVICCAEHIYILGHCFSYTEIYNNQQLLAQLNELGIVIPGPSVG